MFGKLSLAGAVAGALLLAAPAGASAASLPQTGSTVKVAAKAGVTQVHKRRHWRRGYGRRHHRHHRRFYPYYSGYNYNYPGYYYNYQPYRYRHYRRHHRPAFGIYLSF